MAKTLTTEQVEARKAERAARARAEQEALAKSMIAEAQASASSEAAVVQQRAAAQAAAATGGRLEWVALEVIRPSPFQPRIALDDEETQDLVASVAEQGVMSPPEVRPTGDGRYETVYGHRRLAALEILRDRGTVRTPSGIEILRGTTVQVIVRELDDLSAHARTLTENHGRVGPRPWEMTLGVRAYRRHHQATKAEALTVDRLAELIGENRSTTGRLAKVADRLSPEMLQAAGLLDRGDDDLRHAAPVLRTLSLSALDRVLARATPGEQAEELRREITLAGGTLPGAPAAGAADPARLKAGSEPAAPQDVTPSAAAAAAETGRRMGFRLDIPGALKDVPAKRAAEHVRRIAPALQALVSRALEALTPEERAALYEELAGGIAPLRARGRGATGQSGQGSAAE